MKYKIYIGIWIDHKQAYIIYIKNNKSTLHKIESHVSGHPKSAGGTRSKKATGEIISESKYLNKYYNKIISEIKNTDSILIFGPGEAKRELLKRIESSHLWKSKIVGIETVDKMTEMQIISYTKGYYNVK